MLGTNLASFCMPMVTLATEVGKLGDRFNWLPHRPYHLFGWMCRIPFFLVDVATVTED